MPDINTARQEAQEARELVAQKRQEAEEAQEKLRQQAQRLPKTTTQEALRTKFEGMQGRVLRRQIMGMKGQLQEGQRQLQAYGTEVLDPYEEEISLYEQQITEQEAAQGARQAQYEYAVKAYLGLTSGGQIANVPQEIRDLAKEKAEEIERGYYRSYEHSIQEGLAEGETYEIDFPSIAKISGTITTPTLKYTPIEQLPPPSKSFGYLDRTTKTELFPLVSAQDFSCPTSPEICLTSPEDIKIRTTGSPIKMESIAPSGRISDVLKIVSGWGKIEAPETTYYPQYNISIVSGKPMQQYGSISTQPTFQTYKGDISKIKRPTLLQVAAVPFTPVFKFFGGEYEWQKPLKQKYMESLGLPYTSPEQKYREYVSGTPTRELLESGQYPAAVLKLFHKGGETFVSGTEKIRTGLGGKPAGEEAIELAGEIVGEVGMWGFFSPAFSTGAAGKTKQKQVKLSETKFKALEEFYAEVQIGVAEKAAGIEQNKYLAQIYNKFFKGKPQGKEAFKKMLEDLYERGVYKGIPFEAIKPVKEKAPVLFEITADLPYMRGTGTTGGLVSAQTYPPQSQFSDIGKAGRDMFSEIGEQKSRFREIEKTWEGTKKQQVLSSALRKLEKSAQRKGLMTGLPSLLGLKQVPSQKQQPKQATKQRAAQRSALAQMIGLKQAQVQKQIYKQQYKQVYRQQPKPKPKPSVKTLRLFLPAAIEKKKKKDKFLGDVFGIFGRRRGEDILLGRTRTRPQAELGLKKFLKGTLGASGFVSKAGKRVKIDLGMEFRPAKYEPLRIVQKRKYRLGTFPEILEIQKARKGRKKTKRRKEINWFK